MLYRVRFELRQKKPVLVRDVIRVINANFKNMNFKVTLDSKTLDEKDHVQDDRTYIVKCKQERKKTRKSLYNSFLNIKY